MDEEREQETSGSAEAPDEETHEQAAERMREFEQRDEVPSDLSEWPQGKAKYVTFGEDSDSAYGEGPTEKLGPAEVTHRDDGSVSVAGEDVDAEDYKGEPIKSGVIEQIEKSKAQYREMQEENPELKEKGSDQADDG